MPSCGNPYSVGPSGHNFIGEKIIESLKTISRGTAQQILENIETVHSEWSKDVDLNLGDIEMVVVRDLVRIGLVKEDANCYFSLSEKKRISKRTSSLSLRQQEERNPLVRKTWKKRRSQSEKSDL